MVCFGRIFDVRIMGSKSLRVVVLGTILLLVLLALGLLLFVELALVLLVLRDARSMGFVAGTRKTASYQRAILYSRRRILTVSCNPGM
jgi:hypothetical protein